MFKWRRNGRYTGHIDTALATFVSGWAADLSNLDKAVDVEILAGAEVVATAEANLYRIDLMHAGMGDGKHAFEAHLPPMSAQTDLEIRARVRGSTGFLQCGAPNVYSTRVDSRIFVTRIAADIVNNCNLRCPFCVVDFSDVKKTELMKKETFANLLPLLYTVPDGAFWLSCLHEPTLNPMLAEFLHMVPQDCRKKIAFTTNLARKLPESEFEGWASAGIHHINISLDTMNPELFSVLRKNGKYQVFEENLKTLARIFPRYPDAPLVRYITMAFRSNLDEIPRIIEETHKNYLAYENEIRYTYNVRQITDDFRREHYLHKEDWAVLSEKLKPLPYRYAIAFPPEDGYEETIQPSNAFDMEAVLLPENPLVFPLALRGRHDGTLMVTDHERRLQVNVNACADPVEYFRSIRGS